jgi:hypothetical protein
MGSKRRFAVNHHTDGGWCASSEHARYSTTSVAGYAKEIAILRRVCIGPHFGGAFAFVDRFLSVVRGLFNAQVAGYRVDRRLKIYVSLLTHLNP